MSLLFATHRRQIFSRRGPNISLVICSHLKTACSAGTSAASVANTKQNRSGRIIYSWLQVVVQDPALTVDIFWLLRTGAHVQLEKLCK